MNEQHVTLREMSRERTVSLVRRLVAATNVSGNKWVEHLSDDEVFDAGRRIFLDLAKGATQRDGIPVSKVHTMRAGDGTKRIVLELANGYLLAVPFHGA